MSQGRLSGHVGEVFLSRRRRRERLKPSAHTQDAAFVRAVRTRKSRARRIQYKVAALQKKEGHLPRFVRNLFRRYLEIGSVVRLKAVLDAENVRLPVRVVGTGRATGAA